MEILKIYTKLHLENIEFNKYLKNFDFKEYESIWARILYLCQLMTLDEKKFKDTQIFRKVFYLLRNLDDIETNGMKVLIEEENNISNFKYKKLDGEYFKDAKKHILRLFLNFDVFGLKNKKNGAKINKEFKRILASIKKSRISNNA